MREHNGKFWLVTNDGKRYKLSSSQDLSAHIGHDVRVTGDNSSASAGANSQTPTSTGKQRHGERQRTPTGTLNVTNLDMVSTTCPGGANGNSSNPQ